MASASLAVFFRSATIFLLFRFFESGMISYSGSKLFWTSTPRPFEGRSLMCPIEAFTIKSLPRYLLIVFALAGDSTTTRFFAIYLRFRSRTDDGLMTAGCFSSRMLAVWGGLENNINSAPDVKRVFFTRRKQRRFAGDFSCSGCVSPPAG